MATLSEKIAAVNALGRENLANKGVVVAETATTYEIMNAIAEVSGGGGIQYSNIEYKEDNTITLTDKDGITHTMVCTYDDAGKLVGATYDGKSVELTYEGEDLIVGNTVVDLRGLYPVVRTEITYDTIGDLIGEGVRSSTESGKVIKSYEGVSICGYTDDDNTNKVGYYYVVSETKHGCIATNLTYVGTVNYNDKTYHYSKNTYLANINYNNASTKRCWRIGNRNTYEDATAVKRLLDYYYYKAVSE